MLEDRVADDRVCMHYIIERLDEIVSACACQINEDDPAAGHVRDCMRERMTQSLRSELYHNLGVNQHLRWKKG